MASFYNDYRSEFTGNTTVLGDISGSGELYVAGPATCNQTLAVTGNATVGGNLTTAGARSVVSSNITNTQSDGFSTIYLNTPFGIGQMYSGQNEGLVLATNTAHPIRLNANRFAAGAINSIEIKGTGTRDVEINAPLLVKGASTVHSGSVTVNGSLVVGTTNVLTAINNLGASQLSSANVYTKTEVDDKLGLKAPLSNPSFSGTVSSPYLSVANDATISGNVTVNAFLYVTDGGFRLPGDVDNTKQAQVPSQRHQHQFNHKLHLTRH